MLIITITIKIIIIPRVFGSAPGARGRLAPKGLRVQNSPIKEPKHATWRSPHHNIHNTRAKDKIQ